MKTIFLNFTILIGLHLACSTIYIKAPKYVSKNVLQNMYVKFMKDIRKLRALTKKGIEFQVPIPRSEYVKQIKYRRSKTARSKVLPGKSNKSFIQPNMHQPMRSGMAALQENATTLSYLNLPVLKRRKRHQAQIHVSHSSSSPPSPSKNKPKNSRSLSLTIPSSILQHFINKALQQVQEKQAGQAQMQSTPAKPSPKNPYSAQNPPHAYNFQPKMNFKNSGSIRSDMPLRNMLYRAQEVQMPNLKKARKFILTENQFRAKRNLIGSGISDTEVSERPWSNNDWESTIKPALREGEDEVVHKKDLEKALADLEDRLKNGVTRPVYKGDLNNALAEFERKYREHQKDMASTPANPCGKKKILEEALKPALKEDLWEYMYDANAKRSMDEMPNNSEDGNAKRSDDIMDLIQKGVAIGEDPYLIEERGLIPIKIEIPKAFKHEVISLP